MPSDKSLLKPFLLALCLNAGVIAWIGASDIWKAAQAPAQKPKPTLPTRLIQLESMPPEKAQSENGEAGPDDGSASSEKSQDSLHASKSKSAPTPPTGDRRITAREARHAQLTRLKESANHQAPSHPQTAQEPAAKTRTTPPIKPDDQKAGQTEDPIHEPPSTPHARLNAAGPKEANPLHGVTGDPIRPKSYGQRKQGSTGQTPRGMPNHAASSQSGDGKQASADDAKLAGGKKAPAAGGDKQTAAGGGKLGDSRQRAPAGGRRITAVPSPQPGSHDRRVGGPKLGEQNASSQGKNASPNDAGANANANGAAHGFAGQSPARPSAPAGWGQSSSRDWNFGTPVRTPQLPTVHEEKNDAIPGALVPKTMRRPVASPKPHAVPLIPASIGSHSARGNLVWPVDKGQKPKSLKIKGVGKVDGGGDGSGLLGEYFLGQNFEQSLFQRPDPNINFNWTHKTVDPRLPIWNPYSVRWTGKITPRYSETYTFYTASDDGVRLYIDGKLLIDNWSIHPASEDSAQAPLQAHHSYPIVVEYYEKNGRSVRLIKLYWESLHQTKEYVPQSCLSYPKANEH